MADAELRIAAALAECAPTRADRYDYSAKDHSELPALVRVLRERAEAAERERDTAREALVNTTVECAKKAIADLNVDIAGHLEARRLFGASDDESMTQFVGRLVKERDEALAYARRLEWGIARNAHRSSPRKQARWAHVKDVTGFGSSSSKVVCQSAGVNMDEEVGGG